MTSDAVIPTSAAPAPRLACIGASAGGVEALLSLLGPLPGDFALPIVVVLHMPDDHDSVLAGVLQHRLAIEVREARDKETIGSRGLYLAAPGYHLLVERNRSFSFSCDPPLNFSRPSIDLLFASAAHAYGPDLTALLLTGANHDGAEGLAAVAEAGGTTAVQDPATARVATMPEAALRRHPSHRTLSLDGLHALLVETEKNHA